MNKIKYLLVLLLFLVCNVNAKTNDGKLYEVFWNESKVGVFAKDTTYNSMDYNGWMVISDANDYIYYCIEPESYMQNETDATGSSHTVYYGNDVALNSRLNEKTMESIKLLAYYGYGYKDRKIDHTSKKWYGITQVMIWRILRPDIDYVFKESRYGNTNPNLYTNEIKEMESLISNHNLLPSFNNDLIKLTLNEEIVLIDENNVLDRFSISNNKIYDYEIVDNKLKIIAKKEGEAVINLNNQQVNNEFMLFKSTSLQDIVTRGEINIDNAFVNLKIEGKEVIIKKVDKDTNEFNDKLIGSVFNIYDEDYNIINTFTIDEKEKKFILPYGKYYIKEEKASVGYQINSNIYEIIIDKDINKKELIIENEMIKGTLSLLKTDHSSGESLEGVLISIYKDDNTLIYEGFTDEKGKIIVENLLYGDYYILEKEPIKYYRLSNERIDFSIKDNNQIVEKVMMNKLKEGRLLFSKIDSKTQKALPNTKIDIYYEKTNELVFSDYTNEEGQIYLDNLQAGKYYLIEKEEPYGYIRNKNKVYFEIIEENELVQVTMTNDKIIVPNTGSFNSLIYLYYIFGLIFVIIGKKYVIQ